MDKNTSIKRRKRLSFRGLSIQQRLPLLICVLLLCTVVTFGVMSYISVKKQAIEIGNKRLLSLTDQLSALFGQSAQGFIAATHSAANKDSIKKFILSKGADARTGSLEILQKLRFDSTNILIELHDSQHKTVLRSSKNNIEGRVNFDSLLSVAFPTGDTTSVGKIYLAKDSMYYPTRASVVENNKVIGYLVRWKLMQTTPQALQQFTLLMGADAGINVGNRDGSLWTDLVKPVASPPVDRMKGHEPFEYSSNNRKVIGAAKPIANTPWVVVIELSKQKVLESASKFLTGLIIIGAGLIAIGIFVAWLVSRNITRPLNKLTAAASAIATGNYSATVDVKANDETGRLARAFNSMAIQVQNAQQDLEQKVQERTAQLEIVNKELEAFSYSVSHDLRAPLRAINGYASILKQDYADKLDSEANRLADKIVDNATMMGKLIDDLIAFSRIGSQEVAYNTVDMRTIAINCMAEQLQHEPANKYQVHISGLPVCYGDANLIKQVWINLISNAIKYSSKQPVPCIEIGCDEGPLMHTYFVKDNGVGFDMQHVSKLFGVFQRLHSNKMFEGTGIGLAFVKRIINKHNGEIWAEGSVGKGASFYFTLPARPARKPAEINKTGVLSK